MTESTHESGREADCEPAHEPGREPGREPARKPILWSIAGNDSGGGAGLAADQRAALAFGVHLCPVVAAVTAQNSQAVTRVTPLPAQELEAQLAALAGDMPPAAIKTGLLGSVENVQTVARWVDALRQRAPVALVIDPVLGASTGAAFASDVVLRAYCELLVPRATLITPNAAEAARLCGESGPDRPRSMAAAARHARRLLDMGAQAVCVTGGDALAADENGGLAASAAPDEWPGWALDWMDTPHASGWLALPRLREARHTHGTGCTFASSAASALALGFVAADALVLAKAATAHAIAHGYAAGQGAGPAAAAPGFASGPRYMPLLTFGHEDPARAFSAALQAEAAASLFQPASGHQPNPPDIGLYAIVDNAPALQAALAAGVPTLQLRIKTPPAPDEAWRAALRDTLAQGMAACARAGARLFINDHWQLARQLISAHPEHAARTGLHLGQEDLAALTTEQRQGLAASGLPLGISSHSLWELARARSLAPAYIACGPIWPTTTKNMPWRPQGLGNLAFWVATAGRPVTAIGGILTPEQAAAAAQTGASGICVVRALGRDPHAAAPAYLEAVKQGRLSEKAAAPDMPKSAL